MQNAPDSLRDIGSRIRTACGWTFDFMFEYFVEGCLDFRKDSRARSDHICGLFNDQANCARCEVESNLDIPDILVMTVRCPPGINPYPVVDRRWMSFHAAYLRQYRRHLRARYPRQLEAGYSMEEITDSNGTL